MMTKPDTSDLLARMPKAAPASRRARFLAAIGVTLLATGALAAVIGGTVLSARSAQLHRSLEERLELLAGNRVEVVETWTEATARLGSHLVNSDLFRLFATESRLAADTDPLAAQLSAQTPYMAQVLTEFARQNGFSAAYLVGGDGRTLIASGGAPALTADQRDLATRAVASGDTVFAPVRAVGRDLALDILRPVLEMQPADPAEPPEPAAALMITVPATGAIDDFIAPRQLSQDGETVRIVQFGGPAGPVMLDPRAEPPLRPIPTAPADMPEALPFAERPSLAGEAPVFSVGTPVPGLSWLVVQEATREAALAPLGRLKAVVATIGVLATLLVTGALAAIWSLQESRHQRALAGQYRDLAARIDGQRRLLDGINGAIREYIGLKGADGAYSYVNPAFAEALGRPVDRIIGSDDRALFGFATAERLAIGDRQALESGAAITTEEQVYIDGRLHHLEISKVPLGTGGTGGEGANGIVSVARDVTELVEQRRLRETTLKQAVRALVHTVELSDPYLAGHARLVQEFSLLVGRRMGLSQDELATLEVSASLAQIGKLFVPKKLLAKPERLTEEELAIMHTHIEHASAVLGDIDFDLPVHDTVYRMYERLDGTGYPKGCTADEIGVLPRILGACDVFSARIRPRSYRGAITAETALAVLEENAGKYDPAVTAALRQAINSPEGERLLKDDRAAAG